MLVSPTFTEHVALIELEIDAVIVAVPFPLALTVPLETEATLESLVLQDTVLLPFETVTVHVALAPEDVDAVITAVPVDFAVIVPLLTVATLELLVDHLTEAPSEAEAVIVFVGLEYPVTDTDKVAFSLYPFAAIVANVNAVLFKLIPLGSLVRVILLELIVTLSQTAYSVIVCPFVAVRFDTLCPLE